MKIAFTSCMDAIRVPQQPVWTEIQKQNPDVLMLLGDQIYMDWGLGAVTGKWRSRVSKPKGLLAFAIEMHRRYQAQWEVAEFRDLIHWFVALHGHDQLFVCWDDHDFAWNNACGEGNDKNNKYLVPPDVKRISRRLFKQFLEHLKFNHTSTAYPVFDEVYALVSDITNDGVEVFAPTPIGGVRIALLDERWYRIHRDDMDPNHAVPQFLGSTQMGKLQALLAERPLITVVAGGVPLAHKYRNNSDGWSGRDNGEEDYPDLQMFLNAAKSPVLYLGGDIHQNEWGGLMPNSQVIQVAASAAARGSLLIHRFAPSFGIVDIDVHKGTAKVSLRSSNSKNVWSVDENINLGFTANGWSAPLPPGKTRAALAPAPIGNSTDLSVICFRQQEKITSPCNEDGSYPLSAIEEIFSDSELPLGGPAGRPVAVDIQAASDKFTIQVGDTSVFALCRRAFERAENRNAKSVVFFIHGFNNDFAESVDFGYRLRDLYPDIEPIVFSWPAGNVQSNFFDGGYDFKHAFEQTEDICSGLYTALQLFSNAQQAYKNEKPDSTLKTVLVARSLGAQVLSHCLSPATGAGKYRQNALGLNPKLFSGFSHLLLSVPLLKIKLHAETLETLLEHNQHLNVIVTTNRNDNVLSIAESVGVRAPVVGRTLPTAHDMRPASNTTYLDCTAFDGIGAHHNYIIEAWNDNVMKAQELVLTGDWQSATSLDKNTWKQTATNGIWEKK